MDYSSQDSNRDLLIPDQTRWLYWRPPKKWSVQFVCINNQKHQNKHFEICLTFLHFQGNKQLVFQTWRHQPVQYTPPQQNSDNSTEHPETEACGLATSLLTFTRSQWLNESQERLLAFKDDLRNALQPPYDKRENYFYNERVFCKRFKEKFYYKEERVYYGILVCDKVFMI